MFNPYASWYSRCAPSCPTRRSSDLAEISGRLFGFGGGRGRIRFGQKRADLAPELLLDDVDLPSCVEEPEAELVAHRDRKSTRLNSSHLVISYAVFFLKKKNNRL